MNKVLIISESNDKSTDKVIDYCKYITNNTANLFRLNLDSITFENITFEICNNKVNKRILDNIPLDFFDFVWYRRGYPKFIIPKYPKELVPFIQINIEKEIRRLFNSYFNFSKEFESLGNFGLEIDNNKCFDLKIAKSFDLKIPNSIVSTDKKALVNFFNRYEKVITKPLYNVIKKKYKNDFFFSKGTLVCDEYMIKSMNNTTFPIFLQEYIEKKYEIRVFFLVNKLFAMRIYSQNNENTRIDYRNYDLNNPNRLMPHKLERSRK